MEQKEPPVDEIVPPYPLAMVLCDHIWRDQGTGKNIIIGTFSVIHASRFPAVHPSMAVYVALTDGHGKVPITLRIVDVNENHEPLFEGTQELDFPDPRDVVELSFHVGNVQFPGPGEYRFQLLSGTHPLMERRILVNKLRQEAE